MVHMRVCLLACMRGRHKGEQRGSRFDHGTAQKLLAQRVLRACALQRFA
jgi:hypothetical protein